MEIKIRNQNFGYADVRVVEGSTSIEIGCLGETERAKFANQLRRAAYELDGMDTVTKESAVWAIEYYRDNGSMAEFDDAMEMLVEAE